MRRFFLVIGLLGLVAIMAATGCKVAPKEILIGGLFPLTGQIATYGQSSKNGMELAIEEINKAGGVLKMNLKGVYFDEESKVEQAPVGAQKLIDQDKVFAIIGDVGSSWSLAAGPIAQQKKVPMISPASTNPDVTTKVGDYMFRVCFIDPFQGSVVAKFAYDTLGARRAVTFEAVDSDYSIGLAKFFRETFTKLGGEIVGQESYTSTDQDFSAQLTKVKEANPDVIFLSNYYADSALIIKQARENFGITATFTGGDGWDSPEFFRIGGDAVNGNFFSNHFSPDDPDAQAFVEAYKAKFGDVPDALAALAYDATRVLADAIKRAGKLDRAAVRDALAKTKDFKGVTGVITLDENRNPVKSAFIIETKEGKKVFKEKVSP
ncbi:MAG: ABC transporter substrate-binding protein [bacterium]